MTEAKFLADFLSGRPLMAEERSKYLKEKIWSAVQGAREYLYSLYRARQQIPDSLLEYVKEFESEIEALHSYGKGTTDEKCLKTTFERTGPNLFNERDKS